MPAAAQPFEPEVETELVRHLVRQAPTGFAIGTLTAAAVVFVLWNTAPPTFLVGWLAALAFLTLPVLSVVWRFNRARHVAENIVFWRRALGVTYALAGAGWGAASILLYPRVAMPYQLFLLFVLGASGVGGMVALAPVRAAFIGYLTAIYLPIIGSLLGGGSSSSIATGLLLLAFWGAAIALASELHALLVRSIRLRFENLGLIDHLSHARDQAEAASRAKSVFLANVSHELRTPLALILGPTRRLLAADVAGEASRRDLETVERNAQGLLKHVSDLLDVAKLEAGRMELERSRFDLTALVRRTVSLFDIVAQERAVELSVVAPDSCPLVADATKIERVLLNLLSNAMKFVPDGGRVRVEVAPAEESVELSVSDNGPGVPLPLREAIFERFRRGDDSTTRRFGGTGLGLAIARELVECHGGRIEVGDGVEGGARFRVRLPVVAGDGRPAAPDAGAREALDEVAHRTVAELRPRDAPAAATYGTGGQGLVLVIEDNPEMSRFLVECLASHYQVATAFDGRQGVAQALELRPDLILSDVMMPVMAGDALVRELRAHRELDGIPIVVLTAKADHALRVGLLREGAQDFLTKPLTPEELRARVTNFVMLKRTRDVLQAALSSQSRDLTSMADQLAAANRAKDEFLAVLSHELRTPLTPILSWSLLLRQGQLDAATAEHGLETIERNAQLQARIVEDLLDVSRAITGKLRLNVRPIGLEPVVRAAIESVRPAAEAKDICVEVAIGAEPGEVSGDAERLQQVVWNLLANAIKFTPPGGRVEVQLGRVGTHVELRVNDSGTGIEPSTLPRLFERFWQADSSTTRAHGGLGLGLAVVRHLVELHGGTVRAESGGEGQGASFTVALPRLTLRRPAAVGATHAPAAEDAATGGDVLRGLRVMVVDDDLDTCEIVGAVLRRAGAEVRTCMSASQALTVLDSWVPDLLVSDIAMPGEDGYTLIRKVRARKSEEGGRMVAMALTAYGREEDRMRALSAGFQEHVGKPIQPSQLVRLVARVTGHGTGVLH
jgi:signal transduction histidine kinase